MTSGEKSPSGLTGLFLPALTLIAGFGVYFLLFRFLVDPLNPDPAILAPLEPAFLWETDVVDKAEIIAIELEARYAFAIPSVLISLVFLAALIVGFGQVLPQFGRLAIGLGAAALPAGAVIGYFEQHHNPVRALVADCAQASGKADCPLDQAVQRMPEGWLFDAAALDQIRFLVSYNSALSVAAIGLIGVCALFVARTVPANHLDPDYLNRRRIGLETMLVVVGPLLVFSAATTHGFYNFSGSLMAPELAEDFRHLASSGTAYWGAVYSTVLIVATAPAIVSVSRDGIRASRAALPDGTFAERQAWRQAQGVEIALKEKLRLAVAILGPALTAPVLDMVRRIVQ